MDGAHWQDDEVNALGRHVLHLARVVDEPAPQLSTDDDRALMSCLAQRPANKKEGWEGAHPILERLQAGVPPVERHAIEVVVPRALFIVARRDEPLSSASREILVRARRGRLGHVERRVRDAAGRHRVVPP